LKRFFYWFNISFVCLWTTFAVQSLHAVENSSAVTNAFTEDTKEDEFLSPDVAFKLDLSAKDAQNIIANFKIAPGYYLYKNRIKFSEQVETPVKESLGSGVTSVNLPTGDIKDDPNFGKQEVYHHDFVTSLGITKASTPIVIKAIYQGCSEKGLCYAPQTKIISVNLPILNTSLAANSSAASGASLNEDDKTTTALKSGNLWLVVAGFFAAGLLLSFTPCVLPMIPILSSIIVGSQSKQKAPTKLHAFGLSVAYVLGMALSYALAGVAAGLSGNLLSQSLQNSWVLGATALLFVALAFSMFGFYELKLPAAFENKILNFSNKLRGGEFFGVFIMGVISALIVSPCVAAPLASALIYIGQTHNVFLGGIGLFTLAIGMGVPLLLIGASAGSLLPKPGAWMTAVRNLFGVLMLLMAAYIAWPFLPNSLTRPVNNLFLNKSTIKLPFTRIEAENIDTTLDAAKGKPVMLDFYADWCVACKEFEQYTFSDPRVRQALKNSVLLQIDMTEYTDNDKSLLKRFGLVGLPSIIFFDKESREISSFRVTGYKNAEDFTKILTQLNQL